jgi:hypothetical protein
MSSDADPARPREEVYEGLVTQPEHVVPTDSKELMVRLASAPISGGDRLSQKFSGGAPEQPP